jgi:uncharacterized damage-inducible protein DinB
MSDLQYPVGRFEYRPGPTREERAQWIEQIAETPDLLRSALEGLSAAQLETPYRQGGWTVRQVAHHIPESHMNAYVRLKLALTEDVPTIKPYEEARWAVLPDVAATPVDVSLQLLDALHTRFVILLRALTEEDFARRFVHPDHGEVSVDWLVQMYAWHGRHHVGHVQAVRNST